jgi:hypothetical protein
MKSRMSVNTSQLNPHNFVDSFVSLTHGFSAIIDCKRLLLSLINLRRRPTENTSHGLYPLLCDVTTYAEVCLPSLCLETGSLLALFYCCERVSQDVYRAVAWQCVDMSQYVRVYVCVRLHACAPESLDAFYLYSIFIIVSVIDRYPVNMKNPAPKICTLKMGPQKRFSLKGF